MPPILNLRPLRSATDLISLRYQPPICTPTLPTGNCTMLYCLNTSRISCRPPPSNIQAYCWRVLRPNGMPAAEANPRVFPQGEEESTGAPPHGAALPPSHTPGGGADFPPPEGREAERPPVGA